MKGFCIFGNLLFDISLECFANNSTTIELKKNEILITFCVRNHCFVFLIRFCVI